MGEAAPNLIEQFTPEALAEKEVATLAADWLFAKAALDKCQNWLDAVADALGAKLGHKPEGTKSHKVDAYTITLEGRLNRRLDKAKWAEIKPTIPEDFLPTELVEKLSDTRVKWLKENAPDLWRQMAVAITEAPGKLGVKVVRKEVE